MSANHEFVAESFDAVKKCLRAFKAVSVAKDALWIGRGEKARRAKDDELRDALDTAVARLEDCTAPAREAVERLKPFLNGVRTKIVEFGPRLAASLAEAVVARSEVFLRGALPAAEVDLDSESKPGWFDDLGGNVRTSMSGETYIEGLDVERWEAELDLEAGGLELLLRRENYELRAYQLGLYRVEGTDVVFEGALRGLVGYQREFLRRLILAGGNAVSCAELYKALYGHGAVREKQVQGIRYELVQWLKVHGLAELGRCIKGMPSAYRLDLSEYRKPAI